MSEASCDEDDAVDDEVAVDALEALDDELDESSADSRLVRSVSSVDSRVAALDELSVELDDELESLELETPGGGPPGGGPPTAAAPPAELALSELWLPPSELPSCDRKLSRAADNPTAVEASETEIVALAEALADAEEDALALESLEALL
jgi:hypothetical protein